MWQQAGVFENDLISRPQLVGAAGVAAAVFLAV